MSENLSRREALAAALSLSVLPAVAVAADKPVAAVPGNVLTVVVMDPVEPAAKKK